MFYRLCVRNPAFGLLKIGHKLEKIKWRLNLPRHDVIVKFFWLCFVSLSKFSYWSRFHLNIFTSSGVLIIYFYKGLTRNPEVENIPVWVLFNIWRLRWVSDTKLDTDVPKKMLLQSAKFQGNSFSCFWVIKGKPTRG